MQRKEPLENKGVAGMGALPAKNILTRRANHRHISIIAQFARPPHGAAHRARGAITGQNPTVEIATASDRLRVAATRARELSRVHAAAWRRIRKESATY
jgi:hypothetical protein